MKPAELRPIVETWGGVEKFARILEVSNRTVSYWLAGKHKIKPPIAMLIRQLAAKKGGKPTAMQPTK